VSEARRALLEALQGTERGLEGSREAVEELVDVLAASQEDTTTTEAARLTGVWELAWTSEQETLFLLRKGLWRVGPAQRSFQVHSVHCWTHRFS
jgi:hypothetical protein